ncbi:hemerythrin domain-containing protein [Blastococcus sp. CT_GayMR16]|uniref:hemerythrin domain-containing protein n=1 Tax=Blastococcus sp. CT_GayMR16 TaxID=2559607 RepID=UPI0010740958|nr:hemerythrin domain-containing protein [Blastococcus sp. CT_GayMR16]TFV87442.1 hemerythrin domain-containing protein [Blastococcus sp. CT_GayMR16]
MAAVAVRPASLIPVPRSPQSVAPGPVPTSAPAEIGERHSPACRAVAYQRVLHQLVRRELRLLGELSSWAPAAEAERTAALTRHADLIGRVLLHHHAVEREAVWPALLRAVPGDRVSAVRAAIDDWTGRCARIDHRLRDLSTAARQWQVAGTAGARDAFALACLDLADAVDAQTADEESVLLPLLGEHLDSGDWAAIARSSHCRLSAREQLFVLGLALEDSSAADRARLISGLSPATRVAWRLHGRRDYRAAVVRLRGAPPAA